MNYIYLLLFSELILFLIAFFVSGQDILAPSSMFCAVFILSTSLAILNVDNWNIKYCFEAYWILTSGILVFVLTEWFVMLLVRATRHKQKVVRTNLSRGRQIIRVERWKVIAASAFNVICLAWQLWEIRGIVSSVTNPAMGPELFFQYRSITSYNLVDSTELLMNPILTQCLKVVMALGIFGTFGLVNNVVLLKQPLKKNIHFLFFLFCYILSDFMTGGRSSILQIAATTLIISYILYHHTIGWGYVLSWKYIRIGLICLVVGLPAFYLILPLIGRSTDKSLFDYISAYAAGSIQHFNQYIQNPSPNAVVFGEESLVSLQSFFWKIGVSDYHRISHLEYRALNYYMAGNVYTFFRRPLHDFGLGGMYLFTAIISGVFSWVYHAKIKYRYQSFKNDCIILLYGFFYRWIAMGSIDQMSAYLLSFGTAIVCVILVVVFWTMTRVRLVWGSERKEVKNE